MTGQTELSPLGDRVSPDGAQRNNRLLDAAGALLAARHLLLQDVDSRGVPTRAGTTLVGVGRKAVRRELLRGATSWQRENHGIHLAINGVEETTEVAKRFVSSGRRLYSVYSPDGLPEEQLHYFADDDVASRCALAPVPLQMIIFNRSVVVLDGLEIGGERSALAVSDPTIVAAAWEYWMAARAAAVPMSKAFADDPRALFTPRQREIAALLSEDHTDTAIAARLQISLRTVQYEVAAILRLLDARSRFGAGLRLGRLRASQPWARNRALGQAGSDQSQGDLP